MGRLNSIELFNFKSYKGLVKVDLGDAFFSSIIGPNGSGKSNMMDAISFVLGIRSSHLRSSNLRELVYRGRILASNGDEDVATQSEADPQTAYVKVVYQKSDGTEVEWKRT
jgi:structural maintenance of chromosome 1